MALRDCWPPRGFHHLRHHPCGHAHAGDEQDQEQHQGAPLHLHRFASELGVGRWLKAVHDLAADRVQTQSPDLRQADQDAEPLLDASLPEQDLQQGQPGPLRRLEPGGVECPSAWFTRGERGNHNVEGDSLPAGRGAFRGSMMSDVLSDILDSLPEGRVLHAVVGRRWTASVVEVQRERRCGLAASWRLPEEEGRQAPSVDGRPVRSLAADLRRARGLTASLAVATINAALAPLATRWKDEKVEQVIRRCGAAKSVAMVGHFPFADSLRPHIGSLAVLEERPRPGDLPASAAPEVLADAEVVVITGMAFVNGTLEGLLRLCSPRAHVILAGPSTPLSPVFFERGVRELCGAVVEDVGEVVRAVEVSEGLHDLRRAGVRLVTISHVE
jgi:uncharacterized protein (DUF4213/DUF364 family)